MTEQIANSERTPPDAPREEAQPHEARRQEQRALDRTLVDGVKWMGAVRLGSQLAAWVVTLVVARLLAPADYGIVASAAVFISLLRMLTEFGLGTAIVSQRQLRDEQLWQLGGLAATTGGTAALLTVLLAGPVSAFLGVPAIRDVLPVLGISTALAALNALPSAMLQRALAYRSLSKLELARSITASLTVLAFAWAGFGYWSLILNELCAALVFSALLWHRTRYRLMWPRYRDIATSLRISANVMGSRLAWYVFSNADIAIVSRVLGAPALGSYSMGWTLTNVPGEKFTSVLMSVTPGLFARVQDDLPALRRYFLLIIEALATILFPATIGLALVAPEVVIGLLGERWSAAVPVVQILGLVVAIRSITPVCGQLLIARQRSRLAMIYSVMLAVVLPIALYIGTRWGIVGVAAAWAVAYPPFALLQFVVTAREIKLPLTKLAGAVAWPFAGTLLMAGAVWFVRDMLLDAATVGRLAASVATGAVVYVSLLATFRKGQALAALKFLRKRD